MVSRPPQHEFYDERSLEIHRLIALRLRDDPELISTGRKTLKRWIHVSPNKSTDLEWIALLNQGVDAVICAIVEDSDEGRRIRQSSPLLSILPFAERERFRDSFRARASYTRSRQYC